MIYGRKLRIAGIVVAVLLAAYAGFGFLAVPRLVHSAARKFVAQTYGRELALGDVTFNPVTLVLEVHDAALPDKDGQPLLGFRRLLVNLNLSSIFGRVSIDRIECEAPYTHLRIAPDGSLNLADLAKPFEKAESQSAQPSLARSFPPGAPSVSTSWRRWPFDERIEGSCRRHGDEPLQYAIRSGIDCRTLSCPGGQPGNPA